MTTSPTWNNATGRPKQAAERPSPGALELILTPRCNLRCAYCYQGRKQGSAMAWETLAAALDLLVNGGRDELAIAFTGGEPLLELDLIRRAVAHLRRRRPGLAGCALSLSTNGLLLGPEDASFLVAHEIRTQLSCDGVEAAQDERQAGSFAQLDRLLEGLASDHPSWFRRCLSVNLTLTAHNLPWLAASVAYLLARGVSEITVGPAFTHQDAWRVERLAELEEQLLQVERLVREQRRATGREPLATLRRRPRRELGGGALCRVGEGHALTVDSDGQVYGCVAFVPSYQRLPPALAAALAPLAMGAVGDPGLATRLDGFRRAAAASPLLGGRERRRSSYDSCRTCRWRAQCVVCPVALGHRPGALALDRVPDFLCAFQRVAAASRARLARSRSADAAAFARSAPSVEARVLAFSDAWRQARRS